ncbi:hypothetical protein AB0M02_10740 [Actinoplanes sp. NPDC051861]|uniref:hypothetical protein n=1 Tax=Actinoplanes sp. NPDC051861 TaxID=3155170 RepID=UPI00343FCBBC
MNRSDINGLVEKILRGTSSLEDAADINDPYLSAEALAVIAETYWAAGDLDSARYSISIIREPYRKCESLITLRGSISASSSLANDLEAEITNLITQITDEELRGFLALALCAQYCAESRYEAAFDLAVTSTVSTSTEKALTRIVHEMLAEDQVDVSLAENILASVSAIVPEGWEERDFTYYGALALHMRGLALRDVSLADSGTADSRHEGQTAMQLIQSKRFGTNWRRFSKSRRQRQ